MPQLWSNLGRRTSRPRNPKTCFPETNLGTSANGTTKEERCILSGRPLPRPVGEPTASVIRLHQKNVSTLSSLSRRTCLIMLGQPNSSYPRRAVSTVVLMPCLSQVIFEQCTRGSNCNCRRTRCSECHTSMNGANLEILPISASGAPRCSVQLNKRPSDPITIRSKAVGHGI